jgi:hypothetical protein
MVPGKESLMNLEKLKQAQAVFLLRFPGGFDNLELKAIRERKHKPDQMIALVQESFSPDKFSHPLLIVQNMEKVILRSSIVSVFEKMSFRALASRLGSQETEFLASGLEQLLYGDEQAGFEMILDLLRSEKLAKWTLMTLFQTYFHPQRDVFIKPTTVKSVINHFELNHLDYRPTPSWDFYEGYRAAFLDMKSKVDPSLAPTNPAFSGFLWMIVRGEIF